MPQAVTVTPEEREAIERVSLSALVFYLRFKKKKKKKSVALELMLEILLLSLHCCCCW